MIANILRRVARLTVLALITAVSACAVDPSPVAGGVEVTGRGIEALSVAIQWIDGTYGAGCVARSGSWSVRVSGSGSMDYSALSVVQDNTACVLTLTKIVADQTYTATPTIVLATSYAGSGSTMMGSGGLAFYANAYLSSASFASSFIVNVLYSADPNLLTGSLPAGYASVSATASTSGSSAPNYTLNLTTGAFTATVSDTTSSVSSVSGTANLNLGTVAGGGYYVDQGTLAASPTFAQLDAAYSSATTTAISGSPVQIAASAFGLTGVNISSSVVRTIVIQHNVSGVHSYQTFAVTFGCAGGCGVCPSGESSKADGSGMGAGNVCCASTSTTLNCDGTCVNTQVDRNNCGTCGHVCSAATPQCSAGTCVVSCPTGSTYCSGSGLCVDLQSDNNNCGTCGTVCSSSNDTFCNAGTCGSACNSGSFSTGYASCSGVCTNLTSSVANCGSCGNNCSSLISGSSCIGSACACASGSTNCSGTCTNLTNNDTNCGSCGNSCSSLISGSSCVASACVCPSGYAQSGSTCVAIATSGCTAGATAIAMAAKGESGDFNAYGAVCVYYQGSVSGWNANNVNGRTVTATGSTTDTPTVSMGNISNQPAMSPGSNGYIYWNFSAGTYLYAEMDTF